MIKLLLSSAAAAALLIGAAAPAQAVTINYSTDFNSGIGSEWTVGGTSTGNPGIIGQIYGGSEDATLSGVSPGAGSGVLQFDLLGFDSLDGVLPPFTDTFSLIINGLTVFTGSFNLGGGGSDSYSGPLGTTVTGWDSNTGTTWAGGSRTISVPFAILAGLNNIVFSYSPLQGLGDESWGLDNVSVVGEVSAVPLPAALPLLGAALLGIGGISRLRRAKAA